VTTQTRRRSPEERAEAAAKLNDELAQAVETLATSEGWMRYLTTAAKFPSYSIMNQIWLAEQAWIRQVSISRVMGYGAWQEVGRQVTQGQKAFYVIGPIKKRLTAEQAAERAALGQRAYDDQGRPTVVVVGWQRLRVFDISQTIVTDPERWIDAPEMPELTGEAPAGLWDRTQDLIQNEGFALDRHDPTPDDGGALAWVRWSDKVLWIAPQVDEAECVRRALHEVAHVRCEHDGRKVSRAQGELEADSAAWIAGQMLGVDFTDATTIYIAGWAPKDPDERREALKTAVGAVMTAAQSLVADLVEEEPC
jgi:DNA primase